MLREVLEIKPRTKIEFWTDRKYYGNVVKITTEIGLRWGGEEKGASAKNPYIRVRKVLAGKFRRYAGWKLKDYFDKIGITLKELVFLNLVGFLGFMGGFCQSFWRFLVEGRPDVVFLKGGFVGLPVGLVARLFRVPYVIHESDVTVGLANKLLMKKATVVAMGAKFEKGGANWRFVGIPVAEEFKAVRGVSAKKLKKNFGFDPERPLVIFAGGSQGSLNINEAVRKILPEMLKFTSVGLVAGRKYYEEMVDLKKYEVWDKAKLESNFRMWNFSPVMQELMGAADVVVSRAGATTIMELAALKKPTILIPFEALPLGHQVKNAEKIESMGGALVLRDEEMRENPEKLLELVKSLVRSPVKQKKMAGAISEFYVETAAKDLAEILIGIAKGKK